MWADCVIPISIPIILVLGRLTGWLDTKNPLEILREVKPTRDRITESSLLLLGGMCAIAVAIRKINWKYDIRTLEVIVSFIYGFTILVPYRFFRSLIGKSKNMI